MGNVKRDANGVPEEWTLLHTGVNPLVKNGQDYELRLSGGDLDAIVTHHKKKGEGIPLDSNHFLHVLAEQKGIEESEALKLIPSGVAAMGFGTLFRDGDDLRIRAEWIPAAYELLKEKIFRYCSPVIRGLKSGPIRITSVALENEPALNGLDVLAANADETDPEDGAQRLIELKAAPTALESALRHLVGPLGLNDLVLSGGSDGAEKMAEAVEAKAKVFDGIRAGLGVGSDVPDAVLTDALKRVVERAGLSEQLQAELDALKCAAENEARKALIEKGLQEGKLTNAVADAWAKEQDCAALASYLEHAPAIVPGRMEFNPASDRASGKHRAVLTGADRAMIRRFGFDETEYTQCKQF